MKVAQSISQCSSRIVLHFLHITCHALEKETSLALILCLFESTSIHCSWGSICHMSLSHWLECYKIPHEIYVSGTKILELDLWYPKRNHHSPTFGFSKLHKVVAYDFLWALYVIAIRLIRFEDKVGLDLAYKFHFCIRLTPKPR